MFDTCFPPYAPYHLTDIGDIDVLTLSLNDPSPSPLSVCILSPFRHALCTGPSPADWPFARSPARPPARSHGFPPLRRARLGHRAAAIASRPSVGPPCRVALIDAANKPGESELLHLSKMSFLAMFDLAQTKSLF